MNLTMISISVIVTTIVFKISLKTSNTSLSLVKIYSTTLLTSNSTETVSLSSMNQIHVSTYSTEISCYRRVLSAEEKDSKLPIHVSSLLTSLVVFLSQMVVLILFSFSVQILNSFTKSQLLSIQWE